MSFHLLFSFSFAQKHFVIVFIQIYYEIHSGIKIMYTGSYIYVKEIQFF